MRASDFDILCVPETGAAPPEHWIARWASKLSTARLIEAGDAETTTKSLTAAAFGSNRPKLLIGHSTGAVAIAAADLTGADVRGAFLVAPPAESTLPTLLGGWPATPRAPLPWPAVVVASRTDPWAPWAYSRDLARDWNAQLVDAGEAGRLDAESGHGPWPDGLLKLAAFIKPL